MKNIIQILTYALLFCTFLPAQNKFIKANEVIGIADLQNYSVSKLSDIFYYLPDWYSYTIDGFRWQTNSGKTSFGQSQSWLLMVDGQRVDLNFLNMKNINMLPVTFVQIDSVEFSTTPQIISGEFTERGFINICTSKPVNGFSFNAYFTAGNETGDPGPYKYTKYNSVNIDIIGPDFSTALTYGSNNFDVSISYKTNRFLYPTADKPVSTRLEDYDFKYRKIYSDGLSAILNINALPTKPKLTVLYSTSGKYNFLSSYGSDLIYFSPLAKELPVDTKLVHIGFSGTQVFSQFNSFEYSIKFSSNKMKMPVGFEHPDFDWKMNNTLLSANYVHKEENLSYKVGGGIDLNTLKTQYELYQNTNNHYKLYGEISGSSFRKLYHILQLYFGYDTKRVVVKGSFSNNFVIDRNNLLKTVISYSQRNVSENNDIWYWNNRGYNIFENFMCCTSVSNHIGKNCQFNVEAGWIHNFSRSVSFESELFYNKFTNLALESYSYVNVGQGKLETELSSFISHVDGSSGGFKLCINHDVSSSFTHKLRYNYINKITGDKLFKDYYEVFPEHKLLYNAGYSPADDLFISFSLNIISKSKWKTFKDLEDKSQGYINYKIPGKILCNASVQKWFASRRLRLNLAFKNIFNQKNIYTPNGAYSNLTLFLVAELVIN
ncbi:MAG: hypothetical protein PVH88_25585 [Ignavibacteria bacterium]|jgi:hypothetical protein